MSYVFVNLVKDGYRYFDGAKIEGSINITSNFGHKPNRMLDPTWSTHKELVITVQVKGKEHQRWRSRIQARRYGVSYSPRPTLAFLLALSHPHGEYSGSTGGRP
jgi:hypothetical protein